MAAGGNQAWTALTCLQKCNVVIRTFRDVTLGGSHGGWRGFNGTVNASSTKAILQCLYVDDSVVYDMGAAQGIFMLCAAAAGARGVLGIEFAENVGHKLVFDAIINRLMDAYNVALPLERHTGDIDEVSSLIPPWCHTLVFLQLRNIPFFSCSCGKFQAIRIPCTPSGTACLRKPNYISSGSALGLLLCAELRSSAIRIGRDMSMVISSSLWLMSST
jgi:hypothetical protein